MAFDVNSTYTMLQAIEQAYAPNTFFRDTFFPNVETFTTNYVLMDIQKAAVRLHRLYPVTAIR